MTEINGAGKEKQSSPLSYTYPCLDEINQNAMKSPLMNGELFYYILSFIYDTTSSHCMKDQPNDYSYTHLASTSANVLPLPLCEASSSMNEIEGTCQDNNKYKINKDNSQFHNDQFVGDYEYQDMLSKSLITNSGEVNFDSAIQDIENDIQCDSSLSTCASRYNKISRAEEDLNLLTCVKSVCKRWNTFLSIPSFYKYIGAGLNSSRKGNFNFSLMTKIKKHCNGSEGICYKVKYLLDQKDYCLKIG